MLQKLNTATDDPMPDRATLMRLVEQTNPKRALSVTELYAQFERKHTALRAFPATECNPELERRWARTADRCTRIARQILATPAANDAELLLKVRVGVWNTAEFGYEKLEELDQIELEPGRRRYPPPALLLIAALQRDLRRMRDARLEAARRAPFAD